MHPIKTILGVPLLLLIICLDGSIKSIDARADPLQQNMFIPQPPGTVICLTEEQCREKHASLGWTGDFYSDANSSTKFPTKGCFSKKENGRMYFGTGGSIDEMSNDNLPAILERVYCDAPPSIEQEVSPRPEGDERDNSIACLTYQQCKAKHESMNNDGTFYMSDFPTKGCFSKASNNNMYFGTGGSVDDMTKDDLPGVQERVRCNVPTVPEVVTTPSTTQPPKPKPDKPKPPVPVDEVEVISSQPLDDKEEEEIIITDEEKEDNSDESWNSLIPEVVVTDEKKEDNSDESWNSVTPESKPCSSHNRRKCFYDDMCIWNGQECVEIDMTPDEEDIDMPINWDLVEEEEEEGTIEDNFAIWTGEEEDSSLIDGIAGANDEDSFGEELWGLLDPTSTAGAKSHKSAKTSAPTTDMLDSKSSKSKSAKSTSAPTTSASPSISESPTGMSKSSKSKSTKSTSTPTTSASPSISESPTGMSKSSKAKSAKSTSTPTTSASPSISESPTGMSKSSKSKSAKSTSTPTTSASPSISESPTGMSKSSKSKSAKSKTTTTLATDGSTMMGISEAIDIDGTSDGEEDSEVDAFGIAEMKGSGGSAKSSKATTTDPTGTGSTAIPVSKSSKSKSLKTTTTGATVTQGSTTSTIPISKSAKTKSSKSKGCDESAKSSAIMPPPVMPDTMPDDAMPGGIAGGNMIEEPDMVESEEYGTFRDSYLASASSGSANASGEESSPSGVHLWAPIGVAVGLVALLSVMFAVKHRNKRYAGEDGAFPCDSTIDDISPPIHAIPMWGSNLENGIEVSDDEDEPPLHGVLDISAKTLNYENNVGEGITNVDTFPRHNVSPTPEGLTVDQFMGDESFDNPESTLDVFVVTKDANGGNESVVTTSDDGRDCGGIPFMNCV